MRTVSSKSELFRVNSAISVCAIAEISSRSSLKSKDTTILGKIGNGEWVMANGEWGYLLLVSCWLLLVGFCSLFFFLVKLH
ncbi:MAG TPA: hypothetical protein DEG17_00625 [Cyanobacteria bacterium UBA11149]|nr:hypothetical protein [Cyanobacteria bacterium UBA11367]HBE59547.1 hypothetical protein [Cyanobacteria bacterium UBA11366]HBK63855.1 hypothetical protein [Cyanobacteria bacterium UBA11166]HBR75572.1 hypothetical protein [Cyanobacteria bacterium UBA11159]HBS68587.1 hypothetical protein [Cyanobacteria bacterium UBA11153]HBW87421.1 hypothetical protein [Cyanobacteria bacterium UBA11149]HCA95250.1 hypothetical protein [Cyanobacteria bacterium UBA9226]